MKLEGGERKVLKTLLDLQGETGDYVDDARLAAATKMFVQDVRDCLETLEGKGLVERSRTIDGFIAYITAQGRQELRLIGPIPSPKPPGGESPSSAAARHLLPGGEGMISPSPSREKVAEGRMRGEHQPLGLFYSYSHKDEELRKDLEEHLEPLMRQGYIVGWHDRKIGAGEEWKDQLDKNLEEAQIILLLISPSFLASDYCYDIETRRALERHDKGEATVIPILLRPVDWEGSPFARLQGLPIDLRPVTTWTNKDEAFQNIAQGIRKAIEKMRAGTR
jgi:hypothetical protein